MVLRRRLAGRRRLGRKRRAGMRRRTGVPRPLVTRKKYSGIKYFTEVFDAGALVAPGGWFVCALGSMVNSTQYRGLFDLGTIIRYDVMLVPMNGDTVYGTSPQTGRITWANSQNIGGATGYFPAPANELAILQESDSKTLPLDGKRILKFVCRNPKPQVSEQALPTSNNAFTVKTNKEWTWLNMNNNDAMNVGFGGIKYYITAAATDPPYQVLIRVYAAFKEQD